MNCLTVCGKIFIKSNDRKNGCHHGMKATTTKIAKQILEKQKGSNYETRLEKDKNYEMILSTK